MAVTGRAAPKGECKIISDLSLQAGQTRTPLIPGQINYRRPERTAKQIFQHLLAQAAPEFKVAALTGYSDVAKTLSFSLNIRRGTPKK